jgi:signal transduction histidine kinase
VFGSLVDVIRGLAWLASFPLLAHALWQMVEPPKGGSSSRKPHALWLVPGYLTLSVFLPLALGVVSEGRVALADVSREVYPFFLLHAAVCTVVAVRMIRHATLTVESSEVLHFLRWLLGSLLAVLGLVLIGAIVIYMEGDLPRAELVWRLSAEVAGLVLGLTFLYFIQRYNIFRMSVSHRSLRHFIHILALLFLVMLAGPALGIEETLLYRRLVAWGVLLALVIGVTYTPLTEAMARRYIWFRRLLGRVPTREDIDRLTECITDPGLSEEEVLRYTAGELGRLLVAEVRFVSRSSGDEGDDSRESFWEYFSEPSRQAFNRLNAPSPQTSEMLTRSGLHAVFPLRVGDTLESVLTLRASSTGGGYQEGEMEAIRLVLRQVAYALEVRRLMDARLASERRQAEQERLGMLGFVSASLAHELKNPLSSMKVLAQTVQEELDGENATQEQCRDLGLIVEQVDRLSGVAREILDFARPTVADDVDLTSLVTSSSTILEHEARRNGVVFDRSGIETVGRVRGSAAGWQTVVFNLILNAVRHAPKGSTVSVRLAQIEEALLFETENAGGPIPGAIAERLFEPFVSDGDSDDGTGLGLALVRRRIGELGGSVELVNESNGIVFRVRVDLDRRSDERKERA